MVFLQLSLRLYTVKKVDVPSDLHTGIIGIMLLYVSSQVANVMFTEISLDGMLYIGFL